MSESSKAALEKQDAIFKSRLRELAERSYSSGIYTFTDFLSMSELSDALCDREISYAGITVYGGAECCERKMIRFGNEEDLLYSVPFPISLVCAVPLSGEFSGKLTHRDYLGALMNLGIERSCIGDIFLNGNSAYIFCVERMADFIASNLQKAANERLECRVLSEKDGLPEGVGPSVAEKTYSVSSLRVDAVISAVYNLSRSESLDVVKRGEVFVNQRECISPSKEIESGDTVSVRGKGKFIYRGVNYISRKGKNNISVDIYV